MWFKEYVMNVILQPVHLLLYMSLIGAATDLVARNPIYALVAIGFLIPAEKFVKNMFGLNKASSTGDFGSFAKNALAYEGLKKMSSTLGGKGGKGGKSPRTIDNAGGAGENSENSTFSRVKRNELGTYEQNKEATNNDSDLENDENANNPRLADSKELNEEQRRQLEMDNIRKELDEFEGNGGDIYSSMDPEIQDKQLRYQELASEQYNAENIDNNDKAQDDMIRINRDINRESSGGYIRRTAKRAGRNALEATKRKTISGAKGLGKGLAKGTLRAAKGTAKTLAKSPFMAAGATIGLASGIATGDFSNALKYSMGGIAAGSQIGNKVINPFASMASSAASSAIGFGKDVRNIYQEEKYGVDGAKQKRENNANKNARKNFLKDEKEIAKYNKMRQDIGYKGNVKDLMNAAADYKEIGVSDDMIKNALKVEQKRDGTVGGTNHEKMLDIASFASDNGYSKVDILSTKTRTDMENVVASTVGEKDRYEVMKNIADLYGAGDFYSRNSSFNRKKTVPKDKKV